MSRHLVSQDGLQIKYCFCLQILEPLLLLFIVDFSYQWICFQSENMSAITRNSLHVLSSGWKENRKRNKLFSTNYRCQLYFRLLIFKWRSPFSERSGRKDSKIIISQLSFYQQGKWPIAYANVWLWRCRRLTLIWKDIVICLYC